MLDRVEAEIVGVEDVDGEDPAGASSLELERDAAVRCADVEDALAVQPFGQRGGLNQKSDVVGAGVNTPPASSNR